jgi:hypothetical protein
MGSGVGLGTSLGGISEAVGSISGVVTIGLGSKVGLVRVESASVAVSCGLISEVAVGSFVGVHPATTLMIARITTSVIHNCDLFRYIVY